MCENKRMAFITGFDSISPGRMRSSNVFLLANSWMRFLMLKSQNFVRGRRTSCFFACSQDRCIKPGSWMVSNSSWGHEPKRMHRSLVCTMSRNTQRYVWSKKIRFFRVLGCWSGRAASHQHERSVHLTPFIPALLLASRLHELYNGTRYKVWNP